MSRLSAQGPEPPAPPGVRGPGSGSRGPMPAHPTQNAVFRLRWNQRDAPRSRDPRGRSTKLDSCLSSWLGPQDSDVVASRGRAGGAHVDARLRWRHSFTALHLRRDDLCVGAQPSFAPPAPPRLRKHPRTTYRISMGGIHTAPGSLMVPVARLSSMVRLSSDRAISS
jgi:hypothetical protein